MIEKINTSQIQDLFEKSSSKELDSTKTLANNEANASLQVDYASFIDKATQTPQADSDAVEKAQELLSAGELETSQNIQAAAENIVNFGI